MGEAQRPDTNSELLEIKTNYGTITFLFLMYIAMLAITNPSTTDPIVMLKHFGYKNPDLKL